MPIISRRAIERSSSSASSRLRRGVPKNAPARPYRIFEYWAIFTCSRTVMWRHRRRFWKVRLIPMEAILCAGRPLILFPSSRMSPSVGV